MEEKPKKKFKLTKKQFVIGIAAVCGIALIIECALLIHTFSKGKGDRKKGDSGKKGPGKQTEAAAEAINYTATTYRYENGEKILEAVETYERDPDGRPLHVHSHRTAALTGETGDSDEDVVYSYDDQGRLVKEVHTTDRNLPKATTYRYEYDYESYGGTPITVKRKINEEEIQVEVEQSWYNDAGKMTYYSWSSGDGIIKEEHRAYNAMGNLIAAQTTDQDGFHAEYDETARVSDRYLQGRLVCRNHFDEEGRLIRSEDIDIDGNLQFYTVYEYASGPLCTKSTRRTAADVLLYERVFDEQGRIFRIYWYGGSCTEFFDWDYEDPMLPGKKIFRCTTYNGRVDAAIEGKDELQRDFRYVITPMNEVALEAERRKEDKDPSVPRYSFLKTEPYSVPYVTTDGKGHEYGWELDGYNYVDYTMGENGFWYAKSEFEDGRIKSIFVDYATSNSLDSNQLWEYDERENLVSLKELLPDGTVRRELVYEYDYQLGGSGLNLGRQ